jgi:CRP-like cAMP-binding protein
VICKSPFLDCKSYIYKTDLHLLLNLKANTVQAYKQLYKYLSQFISFSDEEFEFLKQNSAQKSFRKKEFFIRAGDVEQHLYFISSGIIRQYFIQGKHQVTTDLIAEGTITGSVSSFFTGKPSHYFLEAMEPVSVLTISKEKLEALYKSDVKWERFGRILTTHFLLQQEKHILENICSTVRERFFHFIDTNQELLQRIPQKYLASYLNIKPETFSRLKGVLVKKLIKKTQHAA